MLHNFLAHRINKAVAESIEYRGRVIDLGCGTAPYKELILKQANEYIGVDWKNSFHDQRNVDVFADISKELPFPDDYADMVTAFQVMEHLEDPQKFLSESHRILRPEGQLVLTVPFMWHVHEAPYDFFRYTRYGLNHLLTKVGFQAADIKENTGFWQTWVLMFNYHTVRFNRGLLKVFFVPLWWIGQSIAPFLDRLDRHPEMTGSYTVVARKKPNA